MATWLSNAEAAFSASVLKLLFSVLSSILHFCHSGFDVLVVCHSSSNSKVTLKSDISSQSADWNNPICKNCILAGNLSKACKTAISKYRGVWSCNISNCTYRLWCPHNSDWSFRRSPSGSENLVCCSQPRRSARFPGGPHLDQKYEETEQKTWMSLNRKNEKII